MEGMDLGCESGLYRGVQDFPGVDPYAGVKVFTDAIVEYTHEGKDGIVLIDKSLFPYGHGLVSEQQRSDLGVKANVLTSVLRQTGLQGVLANDDVPFRIRSEPDETHLVYVVRGFGELSRGSSRGNVAHYSPREVLELLEAGDLAYGDDKVLRNYLASRVATGGSHVLSRPGLDDLVH